VQIPVQAATDSAEVVYVPGTATHAYLAGLLPGESYTLTLYATGTGGGLLGSASGVIPLSPLPAVSAGTGTLNDIATNPTTGKPDDTGQAGGQYPGNGPGATMSANGVYAFFFTQARSNLAPASIYNPASTDVYLLRKDLLTGEIDVASASDGTPMPTIAYEGLPVTTGDGSSVVFYENLGVVDGVEDVPPEVYDLSTGTGWTVGATGDSYDLVQGISANGQVVVYVNYNNADENVHVFRQVEGSAPQQVDNCPVGLAATCSNGGPASMSDDGNLIAYTASDSSWPEDNVADSSIYLYNATTRTDTLMFPRTECASGLFTDQCDEYYDPVLSGDGSTLAFLDEPGEFSAFESFVGLVKVGSQGVTKVATDDNNGFSYYDAYAPVALSDNGGVLLYSDTYEAASSAYGEKLLDSSTNVQPPVLSGSSPTALASASISANGGAVLYTLYQYLSYTPYPGVYLWTP
jgi:hypothetical protein